MSLVINTNTSATIAARNLSTANAELAQATNELSSGSKLVNSSSDAGGLAVSLKLTATTDESTAAGDNIANTQSYLQTQDGVLATAGNVLDRISELYTMYQDPTKNSSDKSNYDAEFNQLQSELTSLSSETFNGVALFGTSGFSVGTSADGTQTVAVSAANLASSTSGVGALTASGVTSLANLSSLTPITAAIQNVASLRATNGAESSRLTFAASVLSSNVTNLESANSQISDVDVAAESTELAKDNVLVQAATAMLTQANASDQIALKLLGA
jgi:flagellin